MLVTAGALKLLELNPLSPDIKMYILLTVLYTFSYETSKENMSKYQDNLFLVITFIFLIT